MSFKPTTRRLSAGSRREAGFTLAEALAALAFLAIVIPVAVQALQVASLAGQVAERKSVAARVADRLLNEQLVTGQWKQSAASGQVEEGTREFRWDLQSQSWEKDSLRLLTMRVSYQVQGKDYDVQLSTLVDNNQP
jgi:type II secretion system protein I